MSTTDLHYWKNKIGNLLQVRVTPKASANKVKPELQANEMLLLRVYVTAAPEDGKANEAVIKLLSKELGMPKSSLSIAQGATSRDKVISIIK